MVKTMQSMEFARLFALRPQNLAWFLGAGASAAAGIPTGYAMITDFKKQLFCQLSKLPLREVDTNDSLWSQRINEFLKSNSALPKPGDPKEYAAAFEAVYPTPEARRAYIEKAVQQGSPSFGHRVLAALLTSKKTQCVFSTNFDTLLDAATIVTDQLVDAQDRANLVVAAIDNAGRAELSMKESRWPLLAKLHGDYQSIELKNTAGELKSQDSRMRSVLSNACGRFGLVVVGYSGRDDSVMEALADAINTLQPFPGGLYWVARSTDSLLPAVTDLLEKASAAGISTAVVISHTFDELAADIADNMVLAPALQRHVHEMRPDPVLREAPLPTADGRKFPVLRCSALPILELPTKALRVETNVAASITKVRELLRETKAWALVAGNGKEFAAFGAEADILRAFASLGGRLAGTYELYPERDSWARGLLYDALARALTKRRPLFARLRSRGHALLVQSGRSNEKPETVERRQRQLAGLHAAYGDALVGNVSGLGYPFHEGVQLRLDHLDGRWWCAFEPFTYVELPVKGDQEIPDEGDSEPLANFMKPNPAADWRRERWAMRYNKAWANIISAWAELLAGDGSERRAIGLEDAAGLDAVFRLSRVTAWSRPAHEHDYFLRNTR
ncbi:MAG TPA: SIR2 family protein [Nevskia sp.]|nr:SIR2 family protein [Nevskia sp.]